MPKVTLKSLKIEGFGSYAESTIFKFDSNGLYCITGKNGAGKSTIFSALYWVLYKKTLKDWTNDNLQSFKWLRGKGYQGTRVMLLFIVGNYKFMAIRHLNYSGVTFGVEGGDSFILLSKPLKDKTPFSDKDMVGDELYKLDQQAYINRLLGIDHRTFINSIVFGQKMKRFIGAEAKDKRALFETLFELDFIDEAKEKADAKKVELEADIKAINENIERIKVTLGHKERELADKEERLATVTQDRRDRLAAIKQEHKLAVDKFNAMVDRLTELNVIQEAKVKPAKKGKVEPNRVTVLAEIAEKASETLQDVKMQAQKNKTNVQGIDQEIQKLEMENVKQAEALREVKDTCTLCGAKLKPDKVAVVKSNIEKIRKQNAEAVRQLRWKRGDVVTAGEIIAIRLKSAQTEFDVAYHEWESGKRLYKTEVDPTETEITKLTSQLEILGQGLEDIKGRYNTEKAKPLPEINTQAIKNAIEIINRDITDIEAKVLPLQQELDRVMWWIKKAFGAAGLKSHMFNVMLQKLNEYAAAYSPYFGYGVKFWIDMNAASKPFKTTIYGNNKEYPYDNMSGGQGQRVDVCLAFAMYDLVTYKSQFNFMVLDEFTEGLDAEGIEMVNQIITKAAETKAVYIITHNPIFVPPSASTILIEDGIDSTSRIVLD